MATLSADEKAMMDNLMAGLDDAFSDYAPTPAKLSKTQLPSRSPLSPLINRKTPKRKQASSPFNAKKKVILSPILSKRTPVVSSAYRKGKGKENAPTPSKAAIAALLEGLSDCDWDDMEFETSTAKSISKLSEAPRLPAKISYSPPATAPTYKPYPCARCVVKSVQDIDLGSYRREKHLIVCEDKHDTTDTKLVILQDDWVLTNAHIGDVVNVLGHFAPITKATSSASTSTASSPTRSIAVSAQQNFIILHPDLLITSTNISSTTQCSRKPIISSLLHSPFNGSESATWGNMLHEVMQDCLAEGKWEKGFIEEKIDHVVRQGMGELARISIGVEKAKEEVRTRAKGIEEFSRKYIGSEPKPDAVLTDARASSTSKATLALTGLHDVEEDLWSPTYGLKGKVDASIQATIAENDEKARKKSTSWTMPLEIKTGRSTAALEHRGQTILYTLLMAERYRSEIPAGLLYYTQSDALIRVKPSRHELRGLIIARNNIASYMVRRQSKSIAGPSQASQSSTEQPTDFLPPTIDEAFTCKRCYAVDGCMLYRKAVEGVVDASSDIADLYDLKTGHLSPERADFFKKWEHLLSLEEQDMVRFRKELWTMTADAREKSGRCFANMAVASYELLDIGNGSRALRHAYQFRRNGLSPSKGAKDSLLNGHITKGDAVTISVEPHLLALARGYVLELTPIYVVVGFDKQITGHDVGPSPAYRIDKDEMVTGMSRVRHNLASLFFADGDTKRLELVVDLRPPEFDEELVPFKPPPSLNSSQIAAMQKVFQARDYALILGMPGTGKTTTIAELIKELVARGKSVLLTSYTHSAVDTILLKLKEVNFEVLRLGSQEKIHPQVRHMTFENKPVPSTLEQLERQIFSPPVVATTCLSIDHPLFSRRTFDYCIVDEASQITLPTCIGPLRFAEKFVLVGDHYQLPPLVRSREAKKGGLDISLFRRLSEAYPQAVVDLIYQYRMNEDIMLLSNKLVYDNRLKCGSDEVARQTLVIPNRQPLQKLHGLNSRCTGEGCWIEALLDESCKAVFVDTDEIPGFDSKIGDLVQNEVEARLVQQLTTVLLSTGVQASQIGVITPYRQQIKLLGHMLQDFPEVEILTADRSQGRDKDCVLMSMVRSNDDGQVGDLLKDWRRMNVSFTRARSKLIIFGSRRTLEGIELLNEFFGLMEEKRWILQLPKDADSLHTFSSPSKAAPPSKRPLPDDVFTTDGAPKKIKSTPRKHNRMEGILNGRPILRDFLNNA